MTNGDTALLEQEIARSRQDMSRALFVIGDRLAPKKVIARAKQSMKGKLAAKLEDVKDRVLPVRVVRRRLHRGKPAIDTQLSPRAQRELSSR